MLNNITCAILAGGKAERLANKQFLLLNGKPLISHVLNAANKYFNQVLIIAKKEQEEKLERIIKNTDNKKQIRVIIENSDDFSPWNGIKAAAENAKTEWVFLLACDMPFVCAEMFELIASQIRLDIDCVIPLTDRLQPLCALYRKSVLEKSPMEGSITRFAESLRKEVVQVSNPDWLFNINTKEDFEKAKEILNLS